MRAFIRHLGCVPSPRLRGEGQGEGPARISRMVRIDKAGDDAREDVAYLALVAAHQHGILERVLRQIAQLGEILVEDLDLLDAGDRFAFRRAPDRKLSRCLIGHDLSYSQGSWVLPYMSSAGADLPSYC